jgi:signal transduction histidine kinase
VQPDALAAALKLAQCSVPAVAWIVQLSKALLRRIVMPMTTQAVGSNANRIAGTSNPSQPPTFPIQTDMHLLTMFAEASTALARDSGRGVLLSTLARLIATITGARDVGVWVRVGGGADRLELSATWPVCQSRFNAVRWLERPLGTVPERAWLDGAPHFARYPQGLGKLLAGGAASPPLWLIPLAADGERLGWVVAENAAEPDTVAVCVTLLKALAGQASHLWLAEQRRAAEAREDAEFTAITAHDLKNVATAVKGYAQLLGRTLAPDLSPRAERAVSVIVSQVDVLVDTLNRMVDLGRLQAGHAALDRGPTDLRDAVVEADASVSVAAGQSATPQLAPIEVVGCWDRRRLVQALGLVLAVANRTAESTGGVPVAVSQRGEQVELRIGERSAEVPWPGPGDWMAQATASLHLARRLLQLQGGALGLRSRPEGGLLITVTLPLENPATTS